MSIFIRIDKTLYEAAKKAAKAEGCSISQQIEFWARIGKCALDNPDLPIKFIKDLLVVKAQKRSSAKPFNFKQK